jgi:2-polyprenyl-3-methyl-5-hydroxy-6-metoxy-1,4-benzoquinol methylase
VSGAPAGVRVSPEGVITGNTFDKYGSTNLVVRRLMSSFTRQLQELLVGAEPGSVLDVGCGEGVLAQRFATLLPSARIVGLDLQESSLQEGWERHRAPNLSYLIGRAEELPFAEGEFDLLSAIEVLEHLPDPERALSEMARCARRHLLLSVPREPLWRVLNVARGAYLSAAGNTPGHLNHWSARSFVNLLSRYGEVVAVRKPLPWTLALVRR